MKLHSIRQDVDGTGKIAAGTELHAPVRAVIRLLFCAFFMLCLLLFLTILSRFHNCYSRRFVQFFYRCCLWSAGIQFVRYGVPCRERSVLYVVNHVSYLDILILGSCMNGSFIAKAEVATWPIIGWLAWLQRTEFIVRRSIRAREQLKSLRTRLTDGDRLILFPEGTSSNGIYVLPFKTALFQMAQPLGNGQPVMVQPISIAYTHLEGIPLRRGLRHFFSWYGDMEILPHLWYMLGLGKVRTALIFHQPVQMAQFNNRQSLAQYCQQKIATGVSACNSGDPKFLATASSLYVDRA